MVDMTDNNFRFFSRKLTKHAFLYTEMLNENAIINIEKTGNKKLLDFTPDQHPLVCQIGGCHPIKVAKAALIAEQWGYDEINLNCGCPS
jgi:tRNA-dihydrouridine synthase A